MALSSWDRLLEYQPTVSRMLSNSFRYNLLHHAYIFEGFIGTKRIDAALLFAKTLLCPNKDENFNPCGVCHQCRRIDENKHPNVFYIEAEGEQIKKRQIRELLTEFSKLATENGPRIYIVNEAERLSQDSSNILLKTMEEPGQDIYQILITSQINSLLKTITSRAQIMHFRPIDKRQIRLDLSKLGFSPLIVDAVSEYTNNTDTALEMVQDPAIVEAVELAIDIFRTLSSHEQSLILLFKDHRDSIFTKTTTTDFFLTIMILFLKDLLNYKIRYLGLIVFSTEIALIEKLSERVSQKKIEDELDKLLGLKSRLKYNINNSLAFDKMLANLERGFDHGISSSAGSV